MILVLRFVCLLLGVFVSGGVFLLVLGLGLVCVRWVLWVGFVLPGAIFSLFGTVFVSSVYHLRVYLDRVYSFLCSLSGTIMTAVVV